MTTTLKYRIIELLSKDLTKFYSISDVAKELKVAYSHAHTFVKQLTKEEVIQIQKIGNVSVCKLNLGGALTCSYLSIIESRKTREWARKNPQSKKIFERIEPIKDNVHSILIKNSKIIIIVPKQIAGTNFSMFRNRVVITHAKLRRNKKQYAGSFVLHGAEKFWNLMSTS